MNAIEHVEQELAELRRRLEQSFSVLDALTGIQTEFEDLAKTYQNLKNGSNGADQLAQFRDTVNRRLSDLEKLIEAARKETLEELMTTQTELSTADRNLRSDMLQQITKLKLEVEGLFSTLKDEWAQPKEAMQSYVTEFESRLRTELRSVINRMEQSGFSPQHLEKLDKLDIRLQAIKGSLINTDKQVKSLRQGLTLAIILSLVAMALPVVLTLAGGDALQNRTQPSVEQTN